MIKYIYLKGRFYTMIRPINSCPNTFRNNSNGKDKYDDPLLNWPLRGAAFTNEVGEAMRPIIGNAATLSWAPALLYIGADVYDKYKNDQTEYSPNSRRALKQAIFQGLASICLPIVAVKGGQSLFSLFGLCTKDKLTINTKEHINKHAQYFVANGQMHAFDGKDDECVKEFLKIISNNMDLSDKRHLKAAYTNNKKNIHNFAEKTIKELIEMRKNLINPSAEYKLSDWYIKYQDALKSGQTENVAVKSILNSYLKQNSYNGKFIKTIGGFIALGLAINPIDKFVEEVLIGKVVAPKLNKKENA